MPDVKMNYNSMEKMAQAFKEAHAQIDESMREMKKLATMMGEGALVGDGGSAFQDAINSKLLKRMQQLHQKMGELEGDISGAVAATRDGIKTAKSRFK